MASSLHEQTVTSRDFESLAARVDPARRPFTCRGCTLEVLKPAKAATAQQPYSGGETDRSPLEIPLRPRWRQIATVPV